MTPSAADTTLRNAHRAVLATLALCALAVTLRGGDDIGSAPELRPYAYAATVLAVGAIFMRRRRSPRSPDEISAHVRLGVASLVCAGGVGAIGVVAAFAGSPVRDGLLYALAGAIFALRPPPSATPAPDPGPP